MPTSNSYTWTREDKLRLKLFHMAYDLSEEPDPTVRFVNALVTSAGRVNLDLMAIYLAAAEMAKGLDARDRAKVFAEACAGANIRRRSAWTVDDKPLSKITI